jgi:hypothetical protein
MAIPRDSRSGSRFLEWRIGLFAAGALVWLAGLLLGQPRLTGAAIVILLAAAALGLLARRH